MNQGFATLKAAKLATRLEGQRWIAVHTYFKSSDGRWYRVLTK